MTKDQYSKGNQQVKPDISPAGCFFFLYIQLPLALIKSEVLKFPAYFVLIVSFCMMVFVPHSCKLGGQ
jgi:hypothetical protein